MCGVLNTGMTNVPFVRLLGHDPKAEMQMLETRNSGTPTASR